MPNTFFHRIKSCKLQQEETRKTFFSDFFKKFGVEEKKGFFLLYNSDLIVTVLTRENEGVDVDGTNGVTGLVSSQY